LGDALGDATGDALSFRLDGRAIDMCGIGKRPGLRLKARQVFL
jgi:hypothetical protein